MVFDLLRSQEIGLWESVPPCEPCVCPAPRRWACHRHAVRNQAATNREKIKGRCPGGWDHPFGCQDGCCGRKHQGAVTLHSFTFALGFWRRRRKSRTKADAAHALLADRRSVGAPRAARRIPEQLGQACAHSVEFSTLFMSNAPVDMLHEYGNTGHAPGAHVQLAVGSAENPRRH